LALAAVQITSAENLNRELNRLLIALNRNSR
jgi:hypothetical protein